ncbi:uncharacterized protein LOC124198172 [Daphnia pulex]|uniref:uncharacterized protein LOC124198172 n=1 Tax=Daphnia pulex TaxID=6669 RepID=UPI001EDE944A|nr:uncharacterized protein LOC124198172 [Daphnia pulex]
MATVEYMKQEMSGMVTKTDLAQTTQRLEETHTSRVESVKNELKATQADVTQKHTAVERVKTELTHVTTAYENLKIEMNANVVSSASTIGRMPKSCDDLQKIGHGKADCSQSWGTKQSTTSTAISRNQPTTQVFKR